MKPDSQLPSADPAVSSAPKVDNDLTKDFVENPQVAAILDRHLEDLQNGIACTREQLLEKHADIADELAEYLDGIEMVAGLGVGKDLVPQQLGDFDVSDVIGQGAMGVVYRAHQKSLKRPVALKVLRYAVTGQQATKRFEREAELVATLDHPHIVPVYAFGQHEKLNFFAMRLIDGESLAHWNADDPGLRDPIAIAQWIAEAARALGHAHQRDVVHRDVKPSNLLKDSDEKIWLTDFGLARRFDDVRMSMTGAMLGTPNYMSPEQAAPARHPIDRRTDIYSLGATLFELLTGRTVFLADTPHAVLAQVLAEEAPLLSDVLPYAPRDLETILMKCLEKEPRDRYQTADDLADDLEAFAAGNPIRGRRPGVIERFARWRKQNNNIVRWAGAAAAATLTLLAISVATWLSWQNATLGRIVIRSDQGPIVGRLIDAQGNKTQSFTIPMQQAMSVKAGRYELETWAKNRIGQAQELFVKAGEYENLKIEMPELSLFSDRTIEGIVRRWQQPDGEPDGIVLMQANAIARFDPVTGKEIWSIDDKQVTAETKSELAAREKNKGEEFTLEQTLLKPFQWRLGDGTSDGDWRVPAIAARFPDINDDQQPDVLIAAKTHPTLISLDGKTGQRLWRYTSLPKHDGPNNRQSRRHQTGGMHEPMVVGDIDGDGINDVTAQFFADKERWIDAVSGKTGEQLWRIEMPEDWFEPAKKNSGGYTSSPVLPMACQISFHGTPARHIHWLGDDWRYKNGGTRHPNIGVVVPWQSTKLPKKNLLLTACGSRLVGYDSSTGKLNPSFNQGQPLDLGYFPALQPQIVRDGEGEIMGLLLCEIVVTTSSGIRPETNFHLLSLDTAKPLWTFTSDCDPGWSGVTPDWPLIEDLNGDGTPEIIVAAGGELEKHSFQSSLVCTLQAIDGATGKPIWDQNALPQLRCASRQIENVVIGPDADGDQLADVYAVCPMLRAIVTSDPSSIFIDVLSGVSGKKIRSVECPCPIWSRQIDLQQPFFWGASPDGSPQLVLSTYRYNSHADSSGTLFVSTRSGHVNHIAGDLSVKMQIPYDRSTNDKTLFLSSPRNGNSSVGTSDLVTVKPQPQTKFRINGAHFRPASDFDGDGLTDLISGSANQAEVVAMATGDRNVLWRYTGEGAIRQTTALDTDLNSDGVNDVLVWVTTDPQKMSKLTCLSGDNGQPLWSREIACTGAFDSLHAVSRPADQKGQIVLSITLKHQGTSLSSLKLLHLDGKTGREQSTNTLIKNLKSYSSMHMLEAKQWPVLFGDFDRDGNTETASVTIDQSGERFLTCWRSNGEILWEKSLAAETPDNAVGELRVSLIQRASGESSLIAVASSTKDNKRLHSTLVRWFDVAQGKLVARWSGGYRLLNKRYQLKHSPALWSGLPFAIRDNGRVLTGICTDAHRRSELLVHVIEIKNGQTEKVGQVKVNNGNENSMEWNGGASSAKFLIVDVDGNGQDDLICSDKQGIVVTTLATGKELMRTEFPNDRLRFIGLTGDSKQIELVSETRGIRHLHLLDLKTLKPNWSVEVPNGSTMGNFVSSKEIPQANFYNASTNSSALLAPQANDYQGDGVAPVASTVTATDPMTGGSAQDPRWIERLPWSKTAQQYWNSRLRFAGFLLKALAICLGAIVFPIWFIYQLVRRKNWSLTVTLLLPLLFVVPYVVLHFNLDYVRHPGATDWANTLGVPLFVGRMLVSLYVLPAVVTFGFSARCWWLGHWRMLGRVWLGVVVYGLIQGASQAMIYGFRLPEGSYFQWWDWNHLFLLHHGVTFVGLALIIYPVFNTGKQFNNRFKNHNRKTALPETS